MKGIKADIIARLERDLLPLQGFKRTLNSAALDLLPGAIKNAFPNAEFPSGAIHEFLYAGKEGAAATCGFVSGILGKLLYGGRGCIWISSFNTIFPPALKSYGIAPENIIFIDLKKEKEILWVMEESLKCDGLAAVIGEIKDLSFTASRRLQLAIEQSGATGFILRHHPGTSHTTACVTRWKVTPVPSTLPGDMPGVGFPRWNVELLKVRNGKPGSWQIEFAEGCTRHISKITAIPLEEKKRTG